MSFCAKHWQDLRDAIDIAGLKDFVAKDGMEAGTKIQKWQAGEATKENFEPLLMAHMNIIAAFIQDGGESAAVRITSDPKCCPICEVDLHSHLGVNWIKGASTDMEILARKAGFI